VAPKLYSIIANLLQSTVDFLKSFATFSATAWNFNTSLFIVDIDMYLPSCDRLLA